MRAGIGAFTLIELLVVLLIVGLALGMVSFGIDSGLRSRQLLRSVEQLAAELELVLQEAEADGRGRGLVLAGSVHDGWSWNWYHFIGNRWQVVASEPGDGGVITHLLPAGTETELRVEGRRLVIAGREAALTAPLPDILLYASGEMTPFVLSLRDLQDPEGEGWQLCGDSLGRIVLREGTASVAGECEVSVP